MKEEIKSMEERMSLRGNKIYENKNKGRIKRDESSHTT